MYRVITGRGPLFFCGHHFTEAAKRFDFAKAKYTVMNLIEET